MVKGMFFVKNWNVPEFIRFNENYVQDDKVKSVMSPFFSDGRWKSEQAFIKFLEETESVEWWFKNGDRDKVFFAVSYTNEDQKPFYIDFIVQMKDGKIGLFDTKAGFTQNIAGPKIDGLRKYIKIENRKGQHLFGGIVTNTDQRNYQGRWIYFNKAGSEMKDNNFDNWETLEL